MGTSARRRFAFLFLGGVLIAGGCQGRPRLAPVEGTVKFKGKPLANLLVEFYPEGPTGPRSTGTTDQNGHYTLVCDDQRPGAFVGTHRVVVRDMEVTGDKFLGRKLEQVGTKGGPPARPSRIPEVYADVSQSPLRQEVKPEPQTIDLDLPAK
jgi:hypothetical protein